MSFDELLAVVVESGDRDKFQRMHGWVKDLGDLLDLIVTLKELERDLAKPDHGNMLPGSHVIVQGRLMVLQAKMKEVEDLIRAPPKPSAGEVAAEMHQARRTTA